MSTQQEQRAQTRSHRPDSAEFRKFIGEKWGPRQPNPYPPSPAIPFCVERRSRLGAQFQGQRLVMHRVKVAAWDQVISGHPDMLASDSVHPQPSGQDLYVQAIVDALNQFAPN